MMCVGMFMAILDVQVVATSLPTIQHALNIAQDQMSWIQTAYLIAEIIAIPLTGFLTRTLTMRWLFVGAVSLFTLASIACAASGSFPSLIFWRVVQGFSGGTLIPAVFSAVFLLFPFRLQTVATTIAGVAAVIAPTTGPVVGGWITETFSWHWLFLINVVPGAIVSVAVWNLVRIDKPMPELLRSIDLWGLAFMAVFLGSFEYVLDEGPRKDWFSEDSVALCAVTATIGGLLFFWRAFTAKTPIVDLHVFRNRNFALGSVLAMAIGLGLYTLIYLTPLFLGQVRGYNSLQIGEVMMVQGAAMFVSAPIVGRLSRYFDLRVLIAFGLVFIATGSWLNGQLTDDWGPLEFAVPQIFRGAGFLFCMFSMTNIAMGTLPANEVKNASGVFNVMRNLGGAIGLASINTLINSRSWLHWQMLSESVRDDRPAVREALAGTTALARNALGGSGQSEGLSLIARQMQQQVAVMTYGDLFMLIAAVMLGVLLLLPLIEKPKIEVPAEAAH